MPSRTKPEKSKASQGYPATQWVSCDLSPEEKDDLRKRDISVDAILSSLAAVIAEGFKISISFDSRSDAVGAYLTAPRDTYPNSTVCLSARAPSLEAALSVLLYKHYEVLQEDWSTGLSGGSKKDQWG